jgi:diguanylate cyclase (GGDEF)-like protein
LVVLFGHLNARPDNLERELLRAGFQVAETEDPAVVPGRATLILLTCDKLVDCDPGIVAAFSCARASGAQVVVLIANGESHDLVRAAEAGADDAILLPAPLDYVIARLRARLASPRVALHGPGSTDLKLFQVLQEIAVELHREEMLHALVRSLSTALEIRSVSVVLHAEGAAVGRLVAATDAPKLRDVDVEMACWPEASTAMATGETFYLGDAGSSTLFAAQVHATTIGSPFTDLETVAAIPLRPMGRTMGTLVLRTRRGEAPLTPGHVSFSELAAEATSRLLEADDRRGAISRRQAIAAHVDPLTGCGTLDALDRRIREEFERARRYDVTFALVLLDVDGMRHINERLGRDGGHRVLSDLGRMLQRELRAPDFVARYGGEEFLLLLPETDLEAGRQTVHRIRARMDPAGLGELHLGVRCRLTAGIVTYPHPSAHKPEDLFALVEAAMLAGKGQDVDRIGCAA